MPSIPDVETTFTLPTLRSETHLIRSEKARASPTTCAAGIKTFGEGHTLDIEHAFGKIKKQRVGTPGTIIPGHALVLKHGVQVSYHTANSQRSSKQKEFLSSFLFIFVLAFFSLFSFL